MEFQNSDASSSNKSSLSASSDEIPKKPPTPITQKIISFDVSDISEISGIASKANSEHFPKNYNLTNAENSYQPTTNFTQMQLNPLNAAILTDQTVPKRTVEFPSQPTATIQQKNPSLDLSDTILEPNKSSRLKPIKSTDPSPPILWEYLKKQDEKWNALQEQIAQILEQKVPCQSNPKMALVPNHVVQDPADCVASQTESPVSSPGNRTMIETCTPGSGTSSENPEITQLLNYLQAQTEQILRLNEQNQKLLEQNMQLLDEKQQLQDCNQELKCKLLFASKRKSLDKPERACKSDQPTVQQSVSLKENYCNTASRNETEVKKVQKSSKPKTNVGYREEKEIEKTSTSTMTSLIYDGNDKVVFQKLTTVTTESKKQCSEISAQCPPKNKETLKTPENRPSPKDPASSSRKRIGKCRKCGKCSPRNATDSARSPHYKSLNASKNGCKMNPESGGKTGSATLQTCEEDIQVHNADSERIMVPRYENILRNVNELNLNCNEVETTPRLKPSSKNGKKHTPPRLTDLSPKTENRLYRRKSSSAASNTTSTDSDSSSNCSIQERSPKKYDLDAKLEESTTISIYGLSSPNLSKDTRRYLDNFGLTRDRPHFSKSRTTLVKRYLR